MAKHGIIITNAGDELINEHVLAGNKPFIADGWHIAVGTGEVELKKSTTSLVSSVFDKHCEDYSGISFGSDEKYGRYAQINIPQSLEGIVIKEMGLYDENDVLIAVASTDIDLTQTVENGVLNSFKARMSLLNIPSDVLIFYTPQGDLLTEDVLNKKLKGYQILTEKAQPNGYAPLDGNKLVPSEFLPTTLPLACINSSPSGAEVIKIVPMGEIISFASPIMNSQSNNGYTITTTTTPESASNIYANAFAEYNTNTNNTNPFFNKNIGGFGSVQLNFPIEATIDKIYFPKNGGNFGWGVPNTNSFTVDLLLNDVVVKNVTGVLSEVKTITGVMCNAVRIGAIGTASPDRVGWSAMKVTGTVGVNNATTITTNPATITSSNGNTKEIDGMSLEIVPNKFKAMITQPATGYTTPEGVISGIGGEYANSPYWKAFTGTSSNVDNSSWLSVNYSPTPLGVKFTQTVAYEPNKYVFEYGTGFVATLNGYPASSISVVGINNSNIEVELYRNNNIANTYNQNFITPVTTTTETYKQIYFRVNSIYLQGSNNVTLGNCQIYKQDPTGTITFDETFTIIADENGTLKQKGKLYSQAYKPTDWVNGDLWFCNDPTKFGGFKNINGVSSEYEFCKVGQVTTSSGAITSVSTCPFNTNGYEAHPQTVVIEAYKNDTSWYRIWSDGWIEQGGLRVVETPGSQGADININFNIPFKINPYMITHSYTFAVNTNLNGGGSLAIMPNTITKTGYAVRYWDVDSGLGRYYWEAKGY